MTLEQAIARAASYVDARIEERLLALEARIRADLAASGPEDEAALDLPPDPDAPWSRVTVEEILASEAVRLDTWRAAMLSEIRTIVAHELGEETAWSG